MRPYTTHAAGQWRSPGVVPGSLAVDHPARLFLCARCRVQVVLCSRCDRGQRYCGRACSGAARREAQRAAAQRYQRSRAGRLTHAERSRRWRQRQREGEDGHGAIAAGRTLHFVTHQGWRAVAPAAPLTVNEPDHAVNAAADEALQLGPRCRRCGVPLSPWVRQGFVRHGLRRWPARVVDPCP